MSIIKITNYTIILNLVNLTLIKVFINTVNLLEGKDRKH